MYRLFNQFWFGNRALDLVVAHTLATLPLHGCIAGTAVRPRPSRALHRSQVLYGRCAARTRRSTRHALRDLVRAAATRLPVVMLDTGMATDEHEDYLFRDIPNVTSLRDRLTPARTSACRPRSLQAPRASSARAAASRGSHRCSASIRWPSTARSVSSCRTSSSPRRSYRQAGAARFDTLDLRARAMQLDLLASAAAVAQGRS